MFPQHGIKRIPNSDAAALKGIFFPSVKGSSLNFDRLLESIFFATGSSIF